jgi:hypothetical protein
MLFLSDRMTSASGSIGGTTFSHNRFGLYTRARRVPVNPNTSFQQSQRDALATASAQWRGLTATQREGWEAYAAATPLTNKLGSTIFLSGSGAYVAAASMALRLGLTPDGDAPAQPGKLAIGVPGLVIDASASTVTVSDLGPDVDGAEIGLFVGDPQSAGVKFFAGPYQLRDHSPVVTGGIAFAAQSGRNSLPYVTGQRIPYRLAGVGTDGNLTTIASGIVTVAA